MTKFMMTCILSVLLCGCGGQSSYTALYASADPIHIIRFDKDLYRLIETGDTALEAGLTQRYPAMLAVTGKGFLNMRSLDTPGFFDKLREFYAEPTLRGLYRDAIAQYDSIAEIERQLGQGFAYLKANFPTMQIPAVYMHVSGFVQNVLVGDSLLSLSIDKYLGKDYPLYQDFFYAPQKEKMTKAHVTPDYLAGWLMSEFPFEGKENVLLDRMIYEGKIKYLVSHALGQPDPAGLIGYTRPSYDWCEKNEGNIWKAIIERKHLYTPDLQTTNLYFEDLPSIYQENDSPGTIGTWMGWQIVNHYMEETNSTPEALMRNNDAQAILTASRYKPL